MQSALAERSPSSLVVQTVTVIAFADALVQRSIGAVRVRPNTSPPTESVRLRTQMGRRRRF